jgi:hypothetical protein
MRVALVLALLVGGAGPAYAHSFFDRWCCSGDDCQPAPLKSVTWTPQGWHVVTPFFDDIVPVDDERIRYVPVGEDQQFYICEYPKKHIRCLYVPEPGG